MRYFVAHLENAPDQPWQESDPHEEIYVIPYGAKVAVATPVGALRHALPALHDGAADLAPATCSGCGTTLPARTS